MIGFLGGTGPLGLGLALRFALAGEAVLLGSRDIARAAEAVSRIEAQGHVQRVRAATNTRVATEADTVIVTVPYNAQATLLQPLSPALARKVVVTTVVPLDKGQGHFSGVSVPEGSAAAQAQRILPESKVVAAFQTVSAVDLWAPSRAIEGDVFVCSDHESAKKEVMALAQRIPSLRAVDSGSLANARYVEEITILLLNINRIYRARTMVRILGLGSDPRTSGG